MSDTTKPGDPADRAADGAFGGVTSHRAGYGDKLQRVEDWVHRHPSATLASGEGAVLLAEIDRLRVENRELRDIRLNMGRGINMLRAAIERVRALHRHDEPCDVGCSTWHDTTFCPTLRALDGEDA
jgi:hypothetical protein